MIPASVLLHLPNGAGAAAIQTRPTKRAYATSACFESLKQRVEVLGVLFFNGKDVPHHSMRRRVLAVEILDDLAITFDRDPLGDQVLANHIDERGSLDI